MKSEESESRLFRSEVAPQLYFQEAAIKEKESEMRVRMEEQNRLRAEAESAARAQQTEQKMTFQRQQKEKQAQSEEMKIMQHQQQVTRVRSATFFFFKTLCVHFCTPTLQHRSINRRLWNASSNTKRKSPPILSSSQWKMNERSMENERKMEISMDP